MTAAIIISAGFAACGLTWWFLRAAGRALAEAERAMEAKEDL